jgi:hypothetical protein
MSKIPIGFAVSELAKLQDLAKRRNDNKKKHAVASKKVDDELSDEMMHYIGLKAEYAVAKLLGVEFNIENTLEGDSGFDLIYRGLTIDVKYSQRDLKFRPGTFKADIAILVQPLSHGVWKYKGNTFGPQVDSYVTKKVFRWRNVLVAGWIDRPAFEHAHTMENFGYNPVEFMAAEDLRSLRDLKEYAEGHAKYATS